MYGLFAYVDISSATFVSMFAFFAAGTKTPFSSIVMGTEMVGGYLLLVPLIISVTISYMISGKNNSIFKNSALGFSILDRKNSKNSMLQQFKVGDAMNSNFYDISKDAGIAEAIQIMKETNTTVLAVTDGEDRLEGGVHYRNLEVATPKSDMTMTVERVMTKAPPCLLPSDTLQKALEIMVRSGLSDLFVVSPADRRLVIGVITLDAISKICDNKRPILIDIENMDETRVENISKAAPTVSSPDSKANFTRNNIWSKLKDFWPLQ